jgi:uncharacterized protein YbaR (Trm112 family)
MPVSILASRKTAGIRSRKSCIRLGYRRRREPDAAPTLAPKVSGPEHDSSSKAANPLCRNPERYALRAGKRIATMGGCNGSAARDSFQCPQSGQAYRDFMDTIPSLCDETSFNALRAGKRIATRKPSTWSNSWRTFQCPQSGQAYRDMKPVVLAQTQKAGFNALRAGKRIATAVTRGSSFEGSQFQCPQSGQAYRDSLQG